MAKLQVNEIFDRIAALEDMDLKIKATDDMCRKEPYLWSLLKMAINPDFKIDRLPPGFPKNFKPETTLPSGISDTNIRTEFRRIQNYIKGGALKVLDEKKLEDSWVALLQGLHYQEAVILTMVKDQNLFEKYPDFWVICPALGIETCINTDVGNHDPALLPLVKNTFEQMGLDTVAGTPSEVTSNVVPPSVDTVTEPPKASPAKTKKGKEK